MELEEILEAEDTQETVETENAVVDEVRDDPDEMDAAATAEAIAEGADEERTKRIYIGPSIPRCGLRHGQILSGDRSAVAGYIGRMEERFPHIRHLMVTPDRLAEAQEKTGDKTSVLHRYYMEIAARAGKRGN